MPYLSNLAPFQLEQIRKLRTSIKEVNPIWYFIFLKLKCCTENSVDSGSTLFTSEFISSLMLFFFAGVYMGLDATKPVFGVSDKTRLEPVSSAIEIS